MTIFSDIVESCFLFEANERTSFQEICHKLEQVDIQLEKNKINDDNKTSTQQNNLNNKSDYENSPHQNEYNILIQHKNEYNILKQQN